MNVRVTERAQRRREAVSGKNKEGKRGGIFDYNERLIGSKGGGWE